MTRPGPLALLPLAVALLAHAPAEALPITLLEVEGSVAVEASAADASDSDFETDSEGTTDFGEATFVLATSARVPDASSQTLGVLSVAVRSHAITALGYVRSIADADRAGGFALASSNWMHRIRFLADVDVLMKLVGHLQARGLGAGDAFVYIELASMDPVTDPLLLRFDAEPGDRGPFEAVASLHAGVTYELLAIARAQADALDDGWSNFEARIALGLTEIPEPATLLCVVSGLALLAARRR